MRTRGGLLRLPLPTYVKARLLYLRRQEMAVRIEKIVATVLDEAHRRQVEGVMATPYEGPEGLYERPAYRPETLEFT